MKLPTRSERRQLRASMRDQQRVVKAQLKEQVARVKARPEVAAAIKRQQAKRVRRLLVLLVAALLLLMLIRCECDPPPAPTIDAGVEVVPLPPAPEKKVVKRRAKKKKATFEGKVDGSDRGDVQVEDTPPTWLQQFRLQVAARSPRLARCFQGSERPGALRWSALVFPRSGRVTESVVEPAFRGTQLTSDQTTCLIKGLTEVPYNLDEPDPQRRERRVSLIFEF